MAQQQQSGATAGAVLREFLLAVERTKQPLDDAIEHFAQALASDAREQLVTKFLEIQPHADAFLHTWPDQHGAGTRWAKRESIATFFRVLSMLLRAQTTRNAGAAEVLALRVVREKNASLEKVLSWSDKPVIEFEALELMTALVRVNGAVAREFVRLFNFQSAPFGKLALRRMKKPEPAAAVPTARDADSDNDSDDAAVTAHSHPQQQSQSPAKPTFQIREAYVRLVLALTACPDKSVHRFAMKEGGLAASLFKSIDGDSVEMLSHLFATLNALVLHNASVDAKTKLVIFNGHCVHQVLPLLQSDDESIARVALDVLNALFFDTGALYAVPRKHALRLFLSKATATATTNGSNDSSDAASHASEIAYAVKVIRNAIVTIGVNEYIRSVFAQRLVVSFLTAYPGLAAEYLHALAIQLEPKPGYRWFGVASLVQKLLACSLEAAAPGLPLLSSSASTDSECVPAWCSSSALATRLILPLSCRKELSRGIQHANNLVVYSSLGIMEAALRRYQFVVTLARESRAVVSSELASELRFLLPSPEALVSLLLKLCASVDELALIYVRALVVFRLYLECLPQAMREVKLDFTKILAWKLLDATNDSNDSSGTTPPPSALTGLIVSEILRFLLAVDANRLHVLLPSGSGSGTTAVSNGVNANASARSKLLQLLQLYVQSSNAAIQQLCARVLEHTLLVSTVFGNDAGDASSRASEETRIWLDALRSGGDACAAFTESLVQHVLADPFQYLETYRRTRSAESGRQALSLSPGTIALVTFFKAASSSSEAASQPPSASNTTGAALAAFRADTSVVVFGTHVLLSLLSIADAPQQLVALITSHEASSADGADTAHGSDNIDTAVAKKRKRADASRDDAASASADAYELLAQYCRSLADSSATRMPAPKKSKATRKEEASRDAPAWRVTASRRRFAQQLFALAPSAFVASWEPIAANCVELTGSLELVFHFLGSWVGGGHLVALFTDRSALDADASSALTKSKKKTKATTPKASGAVASDRFLRELPLPTLLQSVLLDVSEPSNEAVETVATVLSERISADSLDVADAARVCEQLLFALSHARRSGVDSALCRLLLHALSFVVVAAKSTAAADGQIARILRKLHTAANSIARNGASSLLARKLSALEIVGLRLLYSSSDSVAQLEPSSSVAILQRAGVPSVVLLSSLFSVDMRVRLLQTLLQSCRSPSSAQGVLLQHVLRSLDDDADAAATYESFAAYKRRKLLGRKLWQLLAHAQPDAPVVRRSSLTSFYAASFSVLGKLGGVSACEAHAAIDSTLVPILVRAAVNPDSRVPLAELLRRVVLAIHGNSSAHASTQPVVSFVSDLETALATKLMSTKRSGKTTGGAEHALLCAAFDIFTRIESPALCAFVDSLVHESFVRLMDDDGGASSSQCLSFLRHALVESGVSLSTERLALEVASVLKSLAKQHPDGVVLSVTQQTALLLAMRASVPEAQSKTQESAIVFLVKCTLQALRALSKTPDDAALAARVHQLVRVITAVVDDVARGASTATLRAIANALGPQFVRAQELNLSATAAFTAFVALTGVFLKLVVADTATVREALSYDFGDHLAAITDHPQFVECLEHSDDDAARLALVRSVYWLVQLSGVYDRKLFKTLLSVYTMSLSPVDRALRILFEVFDKRAGISLAQFGFRFGASSTTILSAADDAVAPGQSRADLVDDSVWLLSGGLEQPRIRATVEHFPLDREVATTDDLSLLAFDNSPSGVIEQATTLSTQSTAQPYDPAFLLPMLAHFISSSDLPDAAVVQQGLLGIALRATSSNAECVRAYAYGIVAHVHESLTAESAEFKAGRQIHLLLESLRNAVDAPLAGVSSVVTVFLNDAISILCRPIHAMYPHVNHFLLARPAIDLNDVPMFYSLFNSRAPLTYKQERSWFLHALRRGVCEDVDVQLLVRRHVLPILMSFFSSELADDHTQALVAQILTLCLQIDGGAAYLLTKASIVEWIGALLLKHSAAGSDGSSNTGDRKTLLLLADLLESALTASETLRKELDSAQQRALSLQVVNAFAALGSSVQATRAGPIVSVKLARCSTLVLRVAQSACSLTTIMRAVTAISHSVAAAATAVVAVEDAADDTFATRNDTHSTREHDANAVLSCMEAIVSDRLLEHPDLHARTFSDWAEVLSTIADVMAALLASDAAAAHIALPVSNVAHRARSKQTLQRLKSILDQVPVLKQQVLARAARTRIAYAALL